MSRQPIVVGVDASPEAAAAAELGVRLAHALGSPCRLIHAVQHPWASALLAGGAEVSQEFTAVLHRAAREQLGRSLSGRVAPALLSDLIVEFGRPAEVISALAAKDQAGMIVLGGKHHSALGRWLGGSTSHNVVRATAVPVLVTKGAVKTVQRILVALDTSEIAAPTLAVARRLAHALGAEIRALSVIEPLPPLPETGPALDPEPYAALWRDTIETELRPVAAAAGIELLVRTGPTVATIEAEATAWPADLLVLGSHGKNWTQRVMLGSVTERLLDHLPTSLVVVPVVVPVAVREPQRVAAPLAALMPAIG